MIVSNISRSLLRRGLNINRNNLYLDVIRCRHSLPYNTGVVFVPQQEAWVVERMGRFHSVLDPGVNLLIPVLDGIKYVQSLKEIAIEIPKQSAVTSDNVSYYFEIFCYEAIITGYFIY